MIISFPRYVLILLFTALAAVLAPPGRLLAAPVTDDPRFLRRASDLPARRARMNPSNDIWVSFKTNVIDGRRSTTSPLTDATQASPAGVLPTACSHMPGADDAPRAVPGAASDPGAFEGPN